MNQKTNMLWPWEDWEDGLLQMQKEKLFERTVRRVDDQGNEMYRNVMVGECSHCGVEVEKVIAEYRRHPKFFCSKKCFGDYNSKLSYDAFWYNIRITSSGCWEWTQHKDSSGYGMTREGKQNAKTNRVSFRRVHGEFDESLKVCHTCDNPPCINPSHLWIGTHADNMKDMAEKGRAFHKLNSEQIKQIIQSPLSSYQISSQFNVSPRCVRSHRQAFLAGRNSTKEGA